MEHGERPRQKTSEEVRREAFTHHAQIAKDLADLAIGEIDEALAERQDMYDRWLATGMSGVTDDDMLD